MAPELVRPRSAGSKATLAPKLSSAGVERKPGLSWFLVRLSAPALKWQLAQALPSLPACMSQKSALPSTRAQSSSFTMSDRSGMRGTRSARATVDPTPSVVNIAVTTTVAASARE